MPGTHVDQPADIAVGAHDTAHLIGLQQRQCMAITQAAQFLGVFGKAMHVTRLVGQIAITPLQVTLDAVPFDALAHDLNRFDAQQLELLHAFTANDIGELLDAMTDTANQLAAVTPAGAPADLACLQQRNTEPALGQLNGGVEPGKPPAHDTHIDLQLTLQRRVICLQVAAGGVVGGNMPVVTGWVLNAGVHEFVLLAAYGWSGG